MTKEDIIKLAREAGFTDADDDCVWITDGTWDKEFRKFAELIAAAEREACAKVCDELVLDQYSAKGCAAAIRARGQEKREQTSLQRQLIDAGALEANPAGLKARKQK